MKPSWEKCEGTFTFKVRNYRRVEGMLVPMEGEVEWVLPEGRLPYWRGRIVEAAYRLS